MPGSAMSLFQHPRNLLRQPLISRKNKKPARSRTLTFMIAQAQVLLRLSPRAGEFRYGKRRFNLINLGDVGFFANYFQKKSLKKNAPETNASGADKILQEYSILPCL